ncbi:MAG: DUF3429 domain-containing protein [Gammaproteobacteria bacterium]|nr:DUF3429 domain-containing protein [Gammaproteobacteria bacterium]
MKSNRLYAWLTLAGALPFVACALLPLVGVPSVAGLGTLDAIAGSYGLAIVCFVAGSHWGIHLSGKNTAPINLFVSSNVIFLLTWFAWIGPVLNIAIAAQLLAIVVLWMIDYRLRAAEVIDNGYFQIRSAATLIVSIALLIILVT